MWSLGGLHASKLARNLTTATTTAARNLLCQGPYYALSGRSPFKRHIYPMPDGAWLGLHATVDIGGRCKFGPTSNGCPASTTASSPRSSTSSSISSAATIRASRRGACIPTTPACAQALSRRRAGARFRHPRAGEHGHDGLVALYGIESPGLTASLAIGEEVAEMLARR